MTRPTQAELARQFLNLHHGATPLVLPNAWDVTSARIFEEAGFPAIATTSAGIANSLGYPDGQTLPCEEMLAAVRRIVDAVRVPVTADMMAGYGDTPEEIADTVREVLAVGAVGINLEDGIDGTSDALRAADQQQELIRAAVEAAERAQVALVLNARTDVFLRAVGPPETRLPRAIERLNAYRDAGASCMFAPAVTDKETITRLVKEVQGPLNVLATSGVSPVAELAELGVKRVSLGSGPMRATLGLLIRMAEQVRNDGRFELMNESVLPYPDANRLVETRGSDASEPRP